MRRNGRDAPIPDPRRGVSNLSPRRDAPDDQNGVMASADHGIIPKDHDPKRSAGEPDVRQRVSRSAARNC
jgi:hypothetical protein